MSFSEDLSPGALKIMSIVSFLWAFDMHLFGGLVDLGTVIFQFWPQSLGDTFQPDGNGWQDP